jgi:hypothetical protein
MVLHVRRNYVFHVRLKVENMLRPENLKIRPQKHVFLHFEGGFSGIFGCSDWYDLYKPPQYTGPRLVR